jgi:hypothetical protein
MQIRCPFVFSRLTASFPFSPVLTLTISVSELTICGFWVQKGRQEARSPAPFELKSGFPPDFWRLVNALFGPRSATINLF